MKRTRTLVLVSLAMLAAASVSACKKPADNTADNTTPAADSNAPAASNDTNSMGSMNAMDTNATNTPSNSPS